MVQTPAVGLYKHAPRSLPPEIYQLTANSIVSVQLQQLSFDFTDENDRSFVANYAHYLVEQESSVAEARQESR